MIYAKGTRAAHASIISCYDYPVICRKKSYVYYFTTRLRVSCGQSTGSLCLCSLYVWKTKYISGLVLITGMSGSGHIILTVSPHSDDLMSSRGPSAPKVSCWCTCDPEVLRRPSRCP